MCKISLINRPILFSGVQPTGKLTIGNYAGALSQWIAMQYDSQCIFCIVDLHAMTTALSSRYKLYKKTLDTLALYLSCGINPNNSTIFVQSHVLGHAQLAWILSCYSYLGEIQRMTQFKMKSIRRNEINIGLLSYPILMAADILLYQTNLVPVGEDQKQHLELVRNIAIRFNSINGNTFTVPNFLVPKYGGRIMSLLDPTKKMSKSDSNKNNVIYLLDDIDIVKRKIIHAVTDSDYPPVLCYDPIRKPGISNLLEILACISSTSLSELECSLCSYNYKQFKNFLIDRLISILKIIQDKYFIIRKEEDYLNQILKNGAEQANVKSYYILQEVYKALNVFID